MLAMQCNIVYTSELALVIFPLLEVPPVFLCSTKVDCPLKMKGTFFGYGENLRLLFLRCLIHYCPMCGGLGICADSMLSKHLQDQS